MDRVRINLWPIIVIVCVLGVFRVEITHGVSKLTIYQAIDLAFKNNESYLRAVNEVERANQRVVEAQSSALPQINASLNYVRNWELPSFVISIDGEPKALRTGTVNTYSAGLTITQPIYVAGKVFTALSIARKYKKMTLEQKKMAEQNLRLEVIKAYYGAVMADELLKVTAESENLAGKGLDVVNKLFAQGQVSDYEVLRAKVRLANARPQTIQAQANSRLAHKVLNSLIGVPLEEQAELEFVIDSTQYILPEVNLDSAKTQALENRPEIAMVDYQTQILKKVVSIAWGGWRPSIFFSSSLSYQAQSDRDRWPDSNDFLRSSFSAITMSIPVFDSWRTMAQVKQAKIDLSQSRLSQHELSDDIRLDVEQSWWNYKKARESLSSQGQAVEMARRGLDIARLRFENGVGTQLEMFDAEVALTAAETNKVQAFYDLVTGYASFKRAIGEEELIK